MDLQTHCAAMPAVAKSARSTCAKLCRPGQLSSATTCRRMDVPSSCVASQLTAQPNVHVSRRCVHSTPDAPVRAASVSLPKPVREGHYSQLRIGTTSLVRKDHSRLPPHHRHVCTFVCVHAFVRAPAFALHVCTPVFVRLRSPVFVLLRCCVGFRAGGPARRRTCVHLLMSDRTVHLSSLS